MARDPHSDASKHFDAAKSAASSAADNSGIAIAEVGRAAQAYVSEASDRPQHPDNNSSTQEQYSQGREQASDRLEEGQQAAEGVLRNWRMTAEQHAQRTKELAATRVEQGQRSAEEALRSISGSVQNQVQVVQDVASSTANTASDQLRSVTDTAASNLDRGIHTATNVVKGATSQAIAVADETLVQARSYYAMGVAQYKVAEDHLFAALKDGVEVALANPNNTTAVLTGLALVVLPGPRRFLYRQTVGRLRSDESVYLAAKRTSEQLGESVEGQAVEATKLTERLASAEAQYIDGMRKVKAASKQLQYLEKEIAGSEATANRHDCHAAGLARTLRELSSAEAIALRAEVAAKLQAAKMQRKALGKLIYGVTKQGL